MRTRGLTKRYGGRITAVSDLDLTVGRGEVYGFLGPNGSDKTTTPRMLLGLIRPTGGEAPVLGVSAMTAAFGNTLQNPVAAQILFPRPTPPSSSSSTPPSPSRSPPSP